MIAGQVCTARWKGCTAPISGSREVLRCSRLSAPALPPRSSLSSLSPPLPPTSPSSDPTSPTARSGWKPRSRPNPARSPSPSRRCAARRRPPSPSAISAPACRPWRRSSRSRRAKPATGCGSPAPSCRSAPPTSASAPTSSSAPRPPPISRYQRSGNAGEEADALVLLGRTFAERKLWRPALDAYRLSLDLREVAEVRQTYEALRDQHGFRILDYSVDADAASPRACFQFSEDLPGKRTDFSPFVALAGNDKPAITTEEKQLCVEGLKHGERYSITLRAGLPSTVQRDAAEVGRLQHLCARPQPVRALHRQGLCAAAHRPARHSGGQRQHRVREGADPPHRRPQPDRHGARQRLPAQHRPLRPPPARPTRRARSPGRAS